MPPLNQPMPPLESTVMPAAAETMFTFVTGIPMVIVFVIGVVHVVKGKGPLLLLCFLGGLLAASAEPVVDTLSGLYFPYSGQNTAFSNFGRPIPWALVFAYPWYVGGQGYLAYQQFAKRVSGKRIWQMWGLFAVTNALVETPGVLTGFHVYYGNQPLNFWGFPLWAAAVQSIMPMVVGALIYLLRSQVGDSWRLLFVIPLVPMADGLVNGGLDLPMWTTLGNDMSLGANYLGAALTIGMAALAVWLLTIMLGRNDRAASAQTETRSQTKISVSPGAIAPPAPRSP